MARSASKFTQKTIAASIIEITKMNETIANGEKAKSIAPEDKFLTSTIDALVSKATLHRDTVATKLVNGMIRQSTGNIESMLKFAEANKVNFPEN